MLTMLAPSETLSSSNTTLLIFHISPIEAEANIDQLFEHTFFKKILKHNKKKQLKSTVPFTALRFQQRHH